MKRIVVEVENKTHADLKMYVLKHGTTIKKFVTNAILNSFGVKKEQKS